MNLTIPDMKKLKNKKVLMGSIIAVVLLVIALIVRTSTGAPNIATYTAEKGEFIIDIRESGELKAAKSTSVSVPHNVWGQTRITKLVEDGTTVNKDDVLVQFDTSEFENRLKTQQNELDNAKAELTSLNANIDSDRKQQENNLHIQQFSYEQSKLKYQQMKYESLARQREMELEFKKAELSLKQAEEKLESQKIIDEANITKSELKVKQAEMNLQQAKEQLDALTLTAPKSGMAVLQKIYTPNGREKVKVGDSPYRGYQLINIPDLSVMLVMVKVNEIDISRVAVGQQVIITLDALEGPTFYGKVTNVATLARTEYGSTEKIFDIEVTIDGQDKRLKPGMTAQNKIVTDKIDDVLYVPIEAVFDKEDTTIVYVKKRKFNNQIVKIGSKNSDYVIIEEGLSEGEEVALRDPTLPLEDLGIEGSEKGEKKSSGSKSQK